MIVWTHQCVPRVGWGQSTGDWLGPPEAIQDWLSTVSLWCMHRVHHKAILRLWTCMSILQIHPDRIVSSLWSSWEKVQSLSSIKSVVATLAFSTRELEESICAISHTTSSASKEHFYHVLLFLLGRLSALNKTEKEKQAEKSWDCFHTLRKSATFSRGEWWAWLCY